MDSDVCMQPGLEPPALYCMSHRARMKHTCSQHWPALPRPHPGDIANVGMTPQPATPLWKLS